MDKLLKHEHQTRDLGEAAALISSGCLLESLLWKDAVAYFIFTDPNAPALSHDYFYGDLTCNARSYYDNLRMLKRKLITAKEYEGRYEPRA